MRVIVLAQTETEAQLGGLQPSATINTPSPVFVYRTFQKMEGHKMYEDDWYQVIFGTDLEAASKCVDYLVRAATAYGLILEVMGINTYKATPSPRRRTHGAI